MGKFFSVTPAAAMSPRAKYEQRLKMGGANLLLVVVMSLINVILTLLNTDSYFLFSASFPFAMTLFGMEMCGKLPPEYYEGLVFEPLPAAFLYVLVALSLFTILLYAACWFLSKKHSGAWLIVALVLFVFDTLFMLIWFGIGSGMILDYLFHIWVLVDLARGVHAWVKWRHLPPEEEPVGAAPNVLGAVPATPVTSAPDAPISPAPDAPISPAPDAPADSVPDVTATEDSTPAEPAPESADALDAAAAFRKIGATDDTDSSAN